MTKDNHMSSTIVSKAGKTKLVVIGNGMVGHHFIERAIEKGLHDQFEIHIFMFKIAR